MFPAVFSARRLTQTLDFSRGVTMKYVTIVIALILSSCMPNTYYSTTDDYVVGLRWFDRGMAAESGQLPGLTKSPLEFFENAAKYWDPLVEKGDCDAEYRVGLLHALGKAKPKDMEKAIQLWKKAANGNQQRAQWAMGDLYYQNIQYTSHHCTTCSVQKDFVQAYTWYRLMQASAKYDNEKKQAASMLEKLKSEMTPEQINEGEARVSSWKPTPKDCGARNLF